MQAFKTIETSFQEYKRDFSNLIEIAIVHFDVPFATIEIFEEGKKNRIASTHERYNETNINPAGCLDFTIFKKPIQVNDIEKGDKIIKELFFEERAGLCFYASAPLFSKENKLLGIFVVMDDEPNSFSQKQLDLLQRFAKQAAVILELKKSKDVNDALKIKMEQITFKIAHDIRNPLGALKNVVELHQSGILTIGEANEMFRVLVAESNRIIGLTHIIASWGGLFIQSADEHTKPLYLKYIAEEECKKSCEVFSEKKNTIINAIDESIIINANEDLLRFILQQLLSNANKYTTKGNVVIKATKAGERCVISIVDNGVGISEKQLEKINESKEFVNTKGTNKEGGSGMALFLIKELLRESGRKLTIKSEVGKGTEVLVEI